MSFCLNLVPDGSWFKQRSLSELPDGQGHGCVHHMEIVTGAQFVDDATAAVEIPDDVAHVFLAVLRFRAFGGREKGGYGFTSCLKVGWGGYLGFSPATSQS